MQPESKAAASCNARALAAASPAFRQHPKFEAALHLVATGLVDLYAGNRLFNRLLADKGRVVFAHFVLYLHALPESAGGGLTAARMAALCAETGICSRGRTRALLALMRWGGHIAPLEREGDRREKPLAPTDHMLALQRRRWALQFRAICMLDESLAGVHEALEQPAFFNHLIIAMGNSYRAGFRVLDTSSVLAPIAERDGGLMVLIAMLVRENEGALPPAISELSRKFNISRAQVLQVLRAAEAQNLVVRGDMGSGTLTPAGRAAIGDFFASLFALLAHSAHEAFRLTGGSP